jgi:hypothetical protein
MDGTLRDLIIAIAGGIITAVLLYAFQFGLLFTRRSRVSAKAEREQEAVDWRSGDFVKRQMISNAYMFAIMKWFMFGNVFWVGASMIGDIVGKDESDAVDHALAVLELIGLLFFIVTLAKIFRFTKLQQSG